ncbi:MAG: substrate binding domain-containing protein [Gammaproteobacteria bacterium]
MALRVGELEDSTMIARRLKACRLQVCASPDYWEKRGLPEHPNDLRMHNCLIYSQSPKADTWAFTDKNGESVGIKVKGNLRSDTGKLLLSAALEGLGVVTGPSYMFIDAIKKGRLKPVLEDYARATTGLYAVYPYSKLVSSKLRSFVDYLVDEWSQ